LAHRSKANIAENYAPPRHNKAEKPLLVLFSNSTKAVILSEASRCPIARGVVEGPAIALVLAFAVALALAFTPPQQAIVILNKVKNLLSHLAGNSIFYLNPKTG
jgi:hypothetical protein